MDQSRVWKRYVELCPDDLARSVSETPVAFWPLGLIEHHGWHLPVGFDGLKAERLCIRIAEHTGGVLLPTGWWGARGGHGDFKWTHYQAEEAAESILVTTVQQLIAFGFRVLVLVAGHYPWSELLDRNLPGVQRAHPDVLLIWGTECSVGAPEVQLAGDHAAREETSYGLALLPEMVRMDSLRSGRDLESWPGGIRPAEAGRFPALCYDPGDPLYAQLGTDARDASASRGEEGIARLVSHLSNRIGQWLVEQGD